MTSPATVTSVTTSPANGVEHVGDTVTFTIAFESAITVSGGTPTLTLNDGGTAVYDAAASAALGDPSRLVFTYKVGAADQSVTGLSFVRGDQNGAVIYDTASGQGPDFTNLFAASFPGIQVATSPTAVTSVVATPTNVVEHTGDVVTFTIAFSRAIAITGGTPTLTLSNGGTASYDAAATAALGDPSRLVFTYTIGASDTSVVGVSFVRGDQNGAVIVDPSGLGPDFTNLFATNFPNVQVSPQDTGLGGAEIAVDTASTSLSNPQITALANGNFVVTLTDGVQVIAQDGSKIGAKIPFSDFGTPSVTALPAGGFVVTWSPSNGDGNGHSPAVMAQMFAADGTATGPQTLVNTATAGSQLSPTTTALSNGGFVVSWTDTSQGAGGATGDSSGWAVKAQVFAADGTRTGSEILVNTVTFKDQVGSQVIALSNGGFVVTWNDSSGGVGDISGNINKSAAKAQLFAADGTKVGKEILINTPSSANQSSSFEMVVALANGGFAATWVDFITDTSFNTVAIGRLQVFAADGAKVGAQVNIPAAVDLAALSNGEFVLLYFDGVQKVQIFAADGSKVGTGIPVGTATGFIQPNAHVSALPDGGFVVTWQDNANGAGGGPVDNSGPGSAVRAQMFAGDGSKIGDEITVNVNTPYYQMNPAIAALSDGSFAVTWLNWIPENTPNGPTGLPASFQVEARVFNPTPDVTVIAQGTTLEIATATAARLAFADGGAALQLDHSTAFVGQISGFGAADTIDLRDVTFGAGTTLGYRANANNSGGTLTVSDGAHVTALALLGQYTAASFVLGSDGHGGTAISSATEAAQTNTLAVAHA